MKQQITFEQFLEIEKNLEIKMGTIIQVERINNKMLKLTVDLGEETPRTVVTNIGKKVREIPETTEQDLVGHQFPFVTNLAPAVISGAGSEAMIMVAEKDNKIQLPAFSKAPVFAPGAKLF